MTIQAKDSIIINDEQYEIIGQTKAISFNTGNSYLKPKMATTSCMRGYKRGFSVVNNKLYLITLMIRSDIEGFSLDDLAIQGELPKLISKEESIFNLKYDNICGYIPYSGSLVIAKDYIYNCSNYGKNSFQCYEKVIHLLINDGIVKKIADISKILKILRINGRENLNDDMNSIVNVFENDYQW
jgi:hypothetical protein